MRKTKPGKVTIRPGAKNEFAAGHKTTWTNWFSYQPPKTREFTTQEKKELIAELELNDASGEFAGRVTGLPMTYLHEGRQYIAVALSDRRRGKSRTVALALP